MPHTWLCMRKVNTDNTEHGSGWHHYKAGVGSHNRMDSYTREMDKTRKMERPTGEMDRSERKMDRFTRQKGKRDGPTETEVGLGLQDRGRAKSGSKYGGRQGQTGKRKPGAGKPGSAIDISDYFS